MLVFVVALVVPFLIVETILYDPFIKGIYPICIKIVYFLYLSEISMIYYIE